jgi:hypothetical protein
MLEFKRSSGGAVAQLGARLDGIEEVVGSNPIGSTNFLPTLEAHAAEFYSPTCDRVTADYLSFIRDSALTPLVFLRSPLYLTGEGNQVE